MIRARTRIATRCARRPARGIASVGLALLGLLIWAGLGSALDPPTALAAPEGQGASDTAPAALSGTITDLATGRPIAGARVRAGRWVAITGTDGRFDLRLPPSTYQVRIDAEGYSGATAIDQRVGDSPSTALEFGLPPHDPGPIEARSMAALLQADEDGATDASSRAAAPPDEPQDLILAPPLESPEAAEPVMLADLALDAVPSMIRVLMPDGQIVAMDTDTYLKGVVPAEMGYIFRRGFEALKAQAVASRTYAATRCLPDSAGDPERCEPGLDANVDTTTRTQVWRPVHYDLSDAAVDATSDQAAVIGDALVPALFFARALGRTVSSEDSPCCGGRTWPHLRSVASPDPFAAARGHGAGMSQEGAAVLAAWGATFDEIIPYYYTGTRVQPMPESPLDDPLPPADLPNLPELPLMAEDPAEGAGAEAGEVGGGGEGSGGAVVAPPILSGTATLDPSEWSAISASAAAIAEMVPEEARGQAAAPDALLEPGADAPADSAIVIEGEVVAADFPFMALGARWAGDVPPGSQVHVAVRTSRDGVTWSDWAPLLDADSDAKADGADGDAAGSPDVAGADGSSTNSAGAAGDAGAVREEAWTRLLIARGRFVQPRLIIQSPAGSPVPSIDTLDLHYFNSDAGPSAPSGTLSTLSTADTAGPTVISRASWGADERKRFGADGREIWPPAYTEPRAQIIHHTVTTNNPADPAAVVRAIYQYHAVSQGWGDIGYNFLIDHRGNVYEGRYGGERSGRIAQGGHALQYNANTIGAALLGTFTDAAARPSAAAETALVELLASRGLRYGIDPVAPVTLAGTRFSHRVMGHRDALPGHTVCPGNGGYSRVPAIRGAVDVRMDELGALPDPTRTTVPPSPPPAPTSTRAPTQTPVPPVASATPDPQGCTDRVADGDFERENPLWRRNRAYYTQWDVHQGQAALFIGLRADDPDQGQSYASAVQTVRLPDEPGPVRLAFAARTQGDGADQRVVRILDAGGTAIPIGRIELPATSDWRVYSYELGTALASRAGQDIQLYFGVINNGDGRRSYLRLDDVALLACPPGGTQALTPSPESTAEGTPTAPPASPTSARTATIPATSTPALPVGVTPVCQAALAGGDFEADEGSDWRASGDQPALRVSDPVRSGSGALRLGLVDPAEDRFGYAALSQSFTLPRDAVTATLLLWQQPLVHSPEDAFVVELRRPADGTRQILIGPELGAEPRAWARRVVELPPWAAGSELELYLSVLNRGQDTAPGGVTAVVVDDLDLTVCRYPGRLYLPWTHHQGPAAAAYPGY